MKGRIIGYMCPYFLRHMSCDDRQFMWNWKNCLCILSACMSTDIDPHFLLELNLRLIRPDSRECVVGPDRYASRISSL